MERPIWGKLFMHNHIFMLCAIEKSSERQYSEMLCFSIEYMKPIKSQWIKKGMMRKGSIKYF